MAGSKTHHRKSSSHKRGRPATTSRSTSAQERSSHSSQGAGNHSKTSSQND